MFFIPIYIETSQLDPTSKNLCCCCVTDQLIKCLTDQPIVGTDLPNAVKANNGCLFQKKMVGVLGYLSQTLLNISHLTNQPEKSLIGSDIIVNSPSFVLFFCFVFLNKKSLRIA